MLLMTMEEAVLTAEEATEAEEVVLAVEEAVLTDRVVTVKTAPVTPTVQEDLCSSAGVVLETPPLPLIKLAVVRYCVVL